MTFEDLGQERIRIPWNRLRQPWCRSTAGPHRGPRDWWFLWPAKSLVGWGRLPLSKVLIPPLIRRDVQTSGTSLLRQIRVSHKSLRLDVSHRELIEAWMSLFSGANAAVGARLLGPRLPRIKRVRAERSWRGTLPHFASPALDSQSAQGARGS